MGLTEEQLLSAEDIVFAVVDDLLRRRDLAGGSEDEFLRTLTQGQRSVWAVFVIVDGQVNNGGFNQLFWNISDEAVIEAALDGYRLIGADDHRRLLEEAVHRYASGEKQLLPYRRKNTLEAFSASYGEGIFDDLDQRFFTLDSYVLVHQYINNNLDDFVGTG